MRLFEAILQFSLRGWLVFYRRLFCDRGGKIDRKAICFVSSQILWLGDLPLTISQKIQLFTA